MIGVEGPAADRPLRILLVEDSEDDAELIQLALGQGGLHVEARRVASEATFRDALKAFRPDMILADWAMPGFSGGAAVSIAHEWDATVPCILVSGTLGEELVVQALRTGATDYVLKQRLEALVPAVRRALAEAAEHRDRARLEAELEASQAAMREASVRTAARLTILHAIDRAILDSETGVDVATRVVGSLRSLVGAERVSIAEYDVPNGVTKVLAIADASNPGGVEAGAEVPSAFYPPFVERMRTGETLVFSDLAEVVEVMPAARPFAEQGLRAGAFVPLVLGDHLFGAATLMGSHAHFLSDDNLAVVREIMDQVAIALVQARARETIADRESRLNAILEGSPNPILTVDRTAVIRYANSVANSTFVAGGGDLLGRSIHDLLPDVFQDGDSVMTASRPGAEARQAPYPPEDVEAQRLDATTFPAHVLLAPVMTPEGPSAIVTVIDLSERVALEARLRQAERIESLGQFAAILAHDVRNYLTAALWSAELLDRKLSPADPNRADVDVIRRAAQGGLAMTGSVLDFARRSEDARGRTDLRAHLSELRELLARILGDAVRLEVDIAEGLPDVGIKASALTQIVLNLATNSRQAMPEGGTFRISARRASTKASTPAPSSRRRQLVRLLVSDTGTGMDKATREHAFDAFYTTRSSESTAVGTGLGLSSAYLIVTRVGGTIEIESTTGLGTTFTIDLPVAH